MVCDWEYASYDNRVAELVTAKYLEDVIFAVNADTLRVLKTPKLRGFGVEWNAKSLKRLNERFPRLEELFVMMDLEVEKHVCFFLAFLNSLLLRFLPAPTYTFLE